MRFLPIVAVASVASLFNIGATRSEPPRVAPKVDATVTAPSATATPSEQNASDRVPHPVVYIDSLKTQSTRHVPPTVIYETPPRVDPDVEMAAPEPAAHVPPQVVYLDAPPTPPETDAEPAIAPPNPDLDTAEPEVATPEPTPAPAPVIATPAKKEPSAATGPIAALIKNKAMRDLDDAEWSAVSKIYGERSFEPAWLSETGLTPTGRQLVTALNNADNWGLDPKQFVVPEIADAQDAGPALDATTWGELELKLTAAALRYASHARGGRILDPTEQLSSYIDRKPQLKDPAVVLNDLLNAKDPSVALHALHPSHPQFEKLRQKYLALRTANAEPEMVRIPRGALLRNGMKNAQVPLLRQRLEIAETQPEDGSAFDPELFDDGVEAAVKAFQKDYGISSDGLVGNGTRKALNDIQGPDPERLLANMEQWRWMPDDLGDTLIWVNVPEFKVRLVRDGNVVHTERIIAGKFNQQTPVFSDVVETLYFHPKWHVPDSIKVREIYPSLARGGGYVRQQNLKIAYNGRAVNPYNMDWSQRDIRRYHVYQPPGPGNVLGVVKFTFPNKHQVYMHDTPTKHLFKNKLRTYSHGCVRVRDPVRLAELIVEAANGMTAEDVEKILKGPRQETPVKLDKKIPVHVTYLTNWVDEDGNEQSAKDIYGHEKKIKLALAGRFDRIAVGPDHLAPVKYVPRKQQYTGATAVQDFLKNLFPGF